MGGGEKLTLVLAEHLSLGHNVFLFSAEPLDVSSLEQFFDVDLSRVKVICLKTPGSLSRVLARMTGTNGPSVSLHHERQLRSYELDLFINNSLRERIEVPDYSRDLHVHVPTSGPGCKQFRQFVFDDYRYFSIYRRLGLEKVGPSL